MAEERKLKERDQEVTVTPEDAETESAASNEVVEECEQLLVLKEEEVKQLQDRVLRIAAEMENTRRRLERERSEGICFANENLIRDLLPVVDNLERALQHGESETEVQSLLAGIRMTYKSFLDLLAKFGCVPFESVGKTFDPNYHEAVMQQETADYPEKTIVQEFQRGYTLRDRLLRPAMVVVSKAAEGQQQATE